MIERLPYYYRKSKVVKDYYDVVQKIIDKINEDIAAADKRLFIITTDEFSLHEKDVGLSATTANDDTKRARVLARLQGNEVLTVEALKALVSLYEKSGCEVEEMYSEYAMDIIFPNRIGTPENITEILLAIEEVKPAHIRIGLTFNRDLYGEMYMGGMVTKYREITLDTADATRNTPVFGSFILGGTIQTLKIINLEESYG